jgi:hypothetical protein
MIISLLILLILAVVIWYIIQQFPLEAPLDKIVRVVFVVGIALALIDILLGGSLRGSLLR